MGSDDASLFKRARQLAARLPGIETAPHFGRPALKVNGKVVANLCREPGALAVYCPVELKPALIEAEPLLYFDTDHFRSWPAILVWMDAIDDAALENRLEAAWLLRAPPKRCGRGGRNNRKARRSAQVVEEAAHLEKSAAEPQRAQHPIRDIDCGVGVQPAEIEAVMGEGVEE